MMNNISYELKLIIENLSPIYPYINLIEYETNGLFVRHSGCLWSSNDIEIPTLQLLCTSYTGKIDCCEHIHMGTFNRFIKGKHIDYTSLYIDDMLIRHIMIFYKNKKDYLKFKLSNKTCNEKMFICE